MNRLLIGGGDKTALLRHFIQQDFPTGVTIIDPDGSLAEAIADSIPEEHTEQVLYFDPSDAKHIASFNVFERVPAHERAKLVEDLCAFFDALFPAGEETLTRQTSTFVLATILTILLDSENVSFLSVLDFISDTKFRNACIKKCTNPIALLNWDAIANWSNSQKKGALAQVEVKVGTLLLSPIMHRTLQNAPTFYLGKTPIFIANLSRQNISDTAAKLLGTILISRAATPVYINDFGFFASDHLASLFSKGGYTITLRSLSELTKSQAQTVLSFEDKYVSHVTPDDAQKLQPYVNGVLEPKILVDLSRDEFRPELDIDPPLATRRLKAVRKRSNACHTRIGSRSLTPKRPAKKGRKDPWS